MISFHVAAPGHGDKANSYIIILLLFLKKQVVILLNNNPRSIGWKIK